MSIDDIMELARLKGRVIALEAQLESEKAAYKALGASSFVTAVPVEEYEKLKAEVERLRKAGDAMEQEVIGCYFEQDDPADSESLRAWRAAKEGKPQS